MAGIMRDAFADALRRALFAGGLPEGLNARQSALAEWFARGGHIRAVKFADVHAAFPAVAERTLKRDLAALRDARVVRMQGERKGASYRLAR
jgi:predicted DNA-binding transcriptional regulator YafY